MVTSLKVLNDNIGGCSNPSKMPGTSWSISAKRCNVVIVVHAGTPRFATLATGGIKQ